MARSGALAGWKEGLASGGSSPPPPDERPPSQKNLRGDRLRKTVRIDLRVSTHTQVRTHTRLHTHATSYRVNTRLG